ncbi:MAG TPA: cytochrome c [Longimicrobiales bacterium]|nr:cytochrome c [Longimicrobiales bacterium]
MTGSGTVRYGAAIAALMGAVVASACEKPEYERPDRAEQVAQADSLLTPETFDTIAWASDSARAFDGNNAYAAKCRSCHGYLGEGDTEYARQQNVDVPSLVRQDWPYADVEQVRRRVFTGHPAGMPTWGVAGITPREIDAVSYYIAEVLRPEVLDRR